MGQRSISMLLAQHEVGNLLTRGLLVVDDEAPNLDVLRSFLEPEFTVHEAASGLEALQIAETTPLDVIIADQRMPGMTGIEMLERLRNSRPDIASIVLTGYTDTPALISAINKAGVFRYLKKPWQADEVLGAVAQASEHVYQQRAIHRLVDQLSARTNELSETLKELTAAQQGLVHMERLATTGRLAAGITHDLRNAMTGLVFLEREVQGRDADLVEAVVVGLSGVRNLMESLETMNQFVRHKRLSMAMEFFDPTVVVRDAITVMRMDLAFRVRNVQVDAEQGTLPPLLGDRQKLVQVLVNLIRNAVQATDTGDVVSIAARLVPTGATGPDAVDDIVYSVEDAGPGIPANVRETLFDAFVSTKGDAGMGMGLYMSNLIVKNHTGRIACLERAGGGTRFEVALPVARVPG